MKYLFELSKEHKTLPTAEILACLHAEDINFNIIESNEDVFIIETNTKKNKIQKMAKRLSSTYFVNRLLFSCLPNTKDIIKLLINETISKDVFYIRQYT